MLHRAISLYAIKFWNDPNGSAYKAAYFEHFPNIWRMVTGPR